MKKLPIVLAAVAALTLGAVGSAEARDRGAGHGAQKQRHGVMQHRAGPRGFQRNVDRRQARQHGRIRQGAVSGRLNRGQVARLRGKQKHIRVMERHFGADGRYDRQERRILNHALDRSSKRIWRMKGQRHGKYGHGRYGHGRYGAYAPKYRVKPRRRGHRHFRGHHPRRHHRHVEHVYPVYDASPAHSLGLDIETKDFRFSVNKSG